MNRYLWSGIVLAAGVFAMRPASAQVFNPLNGSYYMKVAASDPDVGIDWNQANAQASAMQFNGRQGHLATITDFEENDFIHTALEDAAFHWLGGYQDLTAPDYQEPAGGWRWVTGEAWEFTNWDPAEPNDSFENEHHLIMWFDGQWNDDPVDLTRDGFVVEFSAPVPAPSSIWIAAIGLVPLTLRLRRKRRG
jgi:hypothetical protein